MNRTVGILDFIFSFSLVVAWDALFSEVITTLLLTVLSLLIKELLFPVLIRYAKAFSSKSKSKHKGNGQMD
jgi:hypothetical protein